LRLLDASAILDLWENYPIGQFPTVWAWIEGEILNGELAIPRVALEEVGFRDPGCKTQLEKYGIKEFGIGNDEAYEALQIKSALGIVNDNYHKSGVDENDILIIAIAKTQGVDLITHEAKQPSLPSPMAKYKIPATCSMPQVNVRTLRMIDYIKLSGKVF